VLLFIQFIKKKGMMYMPLNNNDVIHPMIYYHSISLKSFYATLSFLWMKMGRAAVLFRGLIFHA